MSKITLNLGMNEAVDLHDYYRKLNLHAPPSAPPKAVTATPAMEPAVSRAADSEDATPGTKVEQIPTNATGA